VLLTLDNTSSTPLYQQIVDEIRGRILTGQFKPGDPLPSIRQLAADLMISVITTKRAYQDLENEGLIQTRQGRGTFVSEVRGEYLQQVGVREVEEKLVEAVRTASRLGVSRAEVEGLLKKVLGAEESPDAGQGIGSAPRPGEGHQ
jgi:GntR family transcriptional regulator